VLLALTALVAGLLFAEWSGRHRLKAVTKTAAALCFLAMGWQGDPGASTYGMWVFAGLALSVVGDVCLLPAGSGKPFLAGIGTFLLAHVAYGVAFVSLGVHWACVGGVLIPLVGVAWAIHRWLAPDVPAKLRGAVTAYIVVITCMVALSVGAWAGNGRPLLAVAATLFWLSDISVSRDRFKGAGFPNKAWGLPFYFAAQALFALSIAAA
jgi:uncharacterized membrane protein YhhN